MTEGNAAASPQTDPFFGRMNGPDGSALVVGLCGDDMEFYLAIKDDVIRDVRYYTAGCAHTRLCGRAAAELAKGRTLLGALAISPRTIIDALPALQGGERHCAILAVGALHRAIADYWLQP